MSANRSESRPFEAEVSQLLRLMIHSLYSNKEVFLRELISNASDAIDKLRFEALSNESLFEGDTALGIELALDKEARTITIADNGIGMSWDEVAQNIGTIARSGTREFAERLKSTDKPSDTNLIGQFGVGFYSAFIIAERVTLTTRRAGTPSDEAIRWESTGEGTYAMEAVSKEGRGTEIVLHLRPEEDEFLDSWRLKSLVRKYSDHISFPVRITDEEGEEETVNQASALWMRSKSEISTEEYESFYQHVSHDYGKPLSYIHSQVEGRFNYTLLLYVPGRRPFDLSAAFDGKRQGVKLFVRRVFITEDAEVLLPRYLRFVRGVVDSDDLPLNVSREMLQDNRVVTTMRQTAIKRVLSMIGDIAEDADKYATFWKEFGAILKEGVVEDNDQKNAIAPLLRFATTHSDAAEQNVSLPQYLERMKPGQDKIYFVTADTHAAAKSSPHLEVFRKKGIEVLLLSDRVDEWVVSHLGAYEGKSLQSVASADLDLDAIETEEGSREEEKKQLDELAQTFEPLVGRVKETLTGRVRDVRLSRRLTSSPACLVTDDGDMSTHMRRVLKAAGQDIGEGQPILELNPDHPIIKRLKFDTENPQLADWTHVLFDQARLSEGGQLEDPASFVQRLNGLMLEMLK